MILLGSTTKKNTTQLRLAGGSREEKQPLKKRGVVAGAPVAAAGFTDTTWSSKQCGKIKGAALGI